MNRDRFQRAPKEQHSEEVKRRDFQIRCQDLLAMQTIQRAVVSEHARTPGSFARLVLVYVQRRDRRSDYRHMARGYYGLAWYDELVDRLLAGKPLMP